MVKYEVLLELEGLQTVDTVAEKLGIEKQSALNLLSKLKEENYVTREGGGKQKRIYRITARKQRPRSPGMFDIVNKYSPMKVMPWFDHQVHGHYGPEEALIDAIETQSFRLILASMKLFNNIKDWNKLHKIASEKGIWQKVGALYDLSRKYFRVRRMPKKYMEKKKFPKQYLIKDYPTADEKFKIIEQEWNVAIPFKKMDILKVKNDNA